MAETTADVRRDIELTRERMTSTLAELERKLHLGQMVKDNPWPALGLAFGAGLLLSGSQADVKAAAATAVATRGASSRLGTALDDVVANLMQGLGGALQHHVDQWVDQVKVAIGAPHDGAGQGVGNQSRGVADTGASAGDGGSAYGGMTPSSAGSQAASGWSTPGATGTSQSMGSRAD